MKKLRVMTIVGTRPEIIRLSRVISAFDQHCDHLLVHTGQNFDFELSEIFFEDLGIRSPDHFLDAAGGSAAETIGNVIISVDRIMEQTKPDAVVVLGDTNSCLSVIPAKRRKIPTFHLEAGNRCFDMRVPEEINRRIVDHTSDINLTYSQIAREYLLSEGLPADRIIKVGSPMYEVLTHYRNKIIQSDIIDRLSLRQREYFVVSLHREENVDPEPSFQKMVSLLNSVAQTYDKPLIVSTHPRTMQRINASGVSFHEHVKLMKPLSFSDYNSLQINARAVLSDSGTISEEASILGFKALNLREVHERPEAMEEATVMMVGLDLERVHQCLEILNAQNTESVDAVRTVSDYQVPNVSEKVLRIVHSYTDYVSRVVWRNSNSNSLDQ